MEKVKRISASIPGDLLAEFEPLVRKNAMLSRSKALADAIRTYISEYNWKEEKGVKGGIVAIVFDHGVRGTTDKITKIEHSFHHEINSNIHIHLDHNNCLEVIIVKSNAKRINELAKSLEAIRGVKQVKLIKIGSMQEKN